MDLSNAPSFASISISLNYESLIRAMAAAFPRSRFCATYNRHQNFAFPPDSIIYHITKNPSSTKAYQKHIRSCKYFFIQNPILVVSNFLCKYGNNNELDACFNMVLIKDFDKISSKIWVTDILKVNNHYDCDDVQDHFSTNIIPKIYQCDVTSLALEFQIISLSDFIFLASKCTYVSMDEVTVRDEKNAIVPLVKIFKLIPVIKEFRCYFPKNLSNIITSKTAQELLIIPHFANLEFINLSELPEIFEILTFYEYFKKSKTPSMLLNFNGSISEEFKARLQRIGDEIVEARKQGQFEFRIGISS